MHAIGYLSENKEKAMDEFYPGHAKAFNKIGRERGWSPVTRASVERQADEHGAFLIGDPQEVAAKIKRHSETLGGLSRVTFQMDTGGLSQEQLLRSIGLIGEVKERL